MLKIKENKIADLEQELAELKQNKGDLWDI